MLQELVCNKEISLLHKPPCQETHPNTAHTGPVFKGSNAERQTVFGFLPQVAWLPLITFNSVQRSGRSRHCVCRRSAGRHRRRRANEQADSEFSGAPSKPGTFKQHLPQTGGGKRMSRGLRLTANVLDAESDRTSAACLLTLYKLRNKNSTSNKQARCEPPPLTMSEALNIWLEPWVTSHPPPTLLRRSSIFRACQFVPVQIEQGLRHLSCSASFGCFHPL